MRRKRTSAPNLTTLRTRLRQSGIKTTSFCYEDQGVYWLQFATLGGFIRFVKQAGQHPEVAEGLMSVGFDQATLPVLFEVFAPKRRKAGFSWSRVVAKAGREVAKARAEWRKRASQSRRQQSVLLPVGQCNPQNVPQTGGLAPEAGRRAAMTL